VQTYGTSNIVPLHLCDSKRSLVEIRQLLKMDPGTKTLSDCCFYSTF